MKKCPLCRSNNIILSYALINYSLLKCNNCGLLFTDNKKNSSEIINKQIYSHHYLDNYEVREDELSIRFLQRVKEIELLIKGGKLLDYGCSTGMFLNTMKNKSRYEWKYYGIDINLMSIKRAKKNITNVNFSNSTLLNKQYPSNFFDVVTCFDVLEHDNKLASTMKELHRILKKDGILVVQCPNYESILAKLCGTNWDWWSVPDHLYHFSYSYLKKYISTYSFKIILATTWDPLNAFILNIRGSIKGKKPSVIRKVLAKISYVFIVTLWFLILPIKKFIGFGGLSLIYAKKE